MGLLYVIFIGFLLELLDFVVVLYEEEVLEGLWCMLLWLFVVEGFIILRILFFGEVGILCIKGLLDCVLEIVVWVGEVVFE